MAFLILGAVLLWNLVPFAAIGLAYFVTYNTAARRPPSAQRALVAGLILSTAATVASTAYMIVSMFESRDAQAPLAFLFLPILGFWVAVAAFGTGWSVATLLHAAVTKLRPPPAHDRSRRPSIYLALLALFVILAGLVFVTNRLAQYERAESEATTPAELRRLHARASTKSDHNMLMRLAQNPRTPADVLRQLSKENYPSVRYRVARNPGTPPDILHALSRDPESLVRSHLTANPAAPKELLTGLADDPDEQVRMHANHVLKAGPGPPLPKFGSLGIHVIDLLFD